MGETRRLHRLNGQYVRISQKLLQKIKKKKKGAGGQLILVQLETRECVKSCCSHKFSNVFIGRSLKYLVSSESNKTKGIHECNEMPITQWLTDPIEIWDYFSWFEGRKCGLHFVQIKQKLKPQRVWTLFFPRLLSCANRKAWKILVELYDTSALSRG